MTPCTPIRRSIRSGDGQADDGTPVEIATTGPHLIVTLGRFPNGRQFVINVADLAKAVLEQLTRPTT